MGKACSACNGHLPQLAHVHMAHTRAHTHTHTHGTLCAGLCIMEWLLFSPWYLFP